MLVSTSLLVREKGSNGVGKAEVTVTADQGLREDLIFNSLHNFQHTPCFTDMMVKL